ncbi:enoyl-CoA hydratase/isomerase [Fictibacillus macauensis ZFHKF-1]|uniref:Enoyl-CoA hydratase/isomerase n=1 Tax=Fictibacillus macauensis ZFHKF-1 TaxID=1196324 RepID=I8AH35_9BACL|nr:enoyl-CoA hydratase/isomerase family protein [Fictibacillus macauensis]EIT84977.1 enoyl-CoA hydratase/isomerase [Fictibacillus macauensis ZFHKF-1]
MTKVHYTVKNEIAWLTLNRPQQRNAVDFDVIALLKHHLIKAKEDDSVKMLLITGSGQDAFCAGGDVKAFQNLQTAHEAYDMLSRMGEVLRSLFFFPKPTVALLNGTAVGGGCELAAACDFRVATADAKIGFIQGNLGITTGWGGATYLFERITKIEALDLLLSAQKITAVQAHQKGFIQYVIKSASVNEEVSRYLQRYLALPKEVLMTYKRNYIDSLDQQAINSRVEQEIRRCATLWESDVHHQAVANFLT